MGELVQSGDSGNMKMLSHARERFDVSKERFAPAVILALGLLFSAGAEAGTGTCPAQTATANQMPIVFAGNYGISGRGVVTSKNTLSVAAGNVTHDGVLSVLPGGGSASGNWTAPFTMTVTELSSSGSVSRTFMGILTVDSKTCTGGLMLTGLVSGSLAATFVNNGDGVLLSSNVPGVFMTYDLAQRE